MNEWKKNSSLTIERKTKEKNDGIYQLIILNVTVIFIGLYMYIIYENLYFSRVSVAYKNASKLEETNKIFRINLSTQTSITWKQIVNRRAFSRPIIEFSSLNPKYINHRLPEVGLVTRRCRKWRQIQREFRYLATKRSMRQLNSGW